MNDNNQKENNKILIKPFIILFVLSIIIFGALYFGHSKKIENRFDNTLQNYEKSMSYIFNNIITNGINENIYTNSFQTNNNKLQNDSIEKLKLSFEVGFKMLESSMNEIMKNSNDILQFWFAFLSVIMVIFTLAGALINNNILSQAREQLEMIKKEAKEETNKLIEESSKKIQENNLFNLGVHSYDSKDYKMAEYYFNEAIKLNSKNYQAYNNRGIAKSNLAKTKEKNSEEYNKLMNEAIEDYNKAIELNPNFAEAFYNKGLAKSNLAKTKEKNSEEYNKLMNEAIEDYNKAIELNPNYSKVYNNRGLAKYYLGNIDEAIEDYNKAIELNPNYSKAYYNRGLAKLELGKTEEAIKDFITVYELDNNNEAKENSKNELISLAQEEYIEAIEFCNKHNIEFNDNKDKN